MKVETWACDVCNTQKKDGSKEVRDWFWSKRLANGGVVIAPFAIAVINTENAAEPDHTFITADAHFCCITHATQWIEKVTPTCRASRPQSLSLNAACDVPPHFLNTIGAAVDRIANERTA